MDIDPVQQRTADFAQVVLDLARRASALAGGIAIKPALTRLAVLESASERSMATARPSPAPNGRRRSRLSWELNEPIRPNPLPVNELGLPLADFYRIGDVARVLRISPDLLRWRLRAGKCPDPLLRDAKGRLFTLAEVRALLSRRQPTGD